MIRALLHEEEQRITDLANDFTVAYPTTYTDSNLVASKRPYSKEQFCIHTDSSKYNFVYEDRGQVMGFINGSHERGLLEIAFCVYDVSVPSSQRVKPLYELMKKAGEFAKTLGVKEMRGLISNDSDESKAFIAPWADSVSKAQTISEGRSKTLLYMTTTPDEHIAICNTLIQ